MKSILALFLLACIVGVSIGKPYESCPEGFCWAGGSYNRHCGRYGDAGEQCERPNAANYYSTACPCKEGLVCSVINRCQ